ncbi:glycoside hydrolase family 99-like domain-containing protein [Christensenellaceae bacterium OttesenSCG-928-L17]|nr:glycoside hydrolase family 99-like domain-containing protein [Christensenellaceae bacterium OttesenSCG-928-L17]
MDNTKIELLPNAIFETFIPNIHRVDPEQYDSYMTKDIHSLFYKLDSTNLGSYKQKILHYIVFGHIQRFLKHAKYIIINQRDQEYILLLSKYLEHKYPQTKIAIQFIDPVSQSGTCDVFEYQKLPNAEIYSFDYHDKEIYKLEPYNQYVNDATLRQYSKIKPRSDVSFIGKDRGRAHGLIDLSAELFIPNDISADYYVLPDQEYSNGVTTAHAKPFEYKKEPLSLDDYYSKSCESRAILEILCGQQKNTTIRGVEAMFLERKLITNDLNVEKQIYYDPHNIFIIGKDNPKNLKKFINSPFKKVADGIKKQFTYEAMLELLEKNYNKKIQPINPKNTNYRIDLHNKIVDEYYKKYFRAADSQSLPNNIPTIMAIYLPQFHPFKENDKAWGKGFTEWSNAASAKPHFIGHFQPLLPSDLGFYDLRTPGKIKEQTDLAKQYGISGFDFYYYWFSGKKIMEMPIETFFTDKTIDFTFSITWANENWAKTWDAKEDEIIIKQNDKKDDPINFIKDVEKYLLDKRYFRKNNKPVLTIYRPDMIKDVKRYTDTWRKYWKEKHKEDLYLVYVANFGLIDKEKYGFDAERGMLPLSAHIFDIYSETELSKHRFLNEHFSGTIRDIEDIYTQYTTNFLSNDTTEFKCLSPAWDNQARRKGVKGVTYINSSPELYGRTLEKILANEIAKHGVNDTVVYINAWNEWAEGAMLEPSQGLGHACLIATRDAIINTTKERHD